MTIVAFMKNKDIISRPKKLDFFLLYLHDQRTEIVLISSTWPVKFVSYSTMTFYKFNTVLVTIVVC